MTHFCQNTKSPCGTDTRVKPCTCSVCVMVAENKRIRESNAKLLQAMAKCAIPYEGLLIDTESRKWIVPEVWAAMENAIVSAREITEAEEESK